GDSISRIKKFIEAAAFTTEVIVVDDASSDATSDVVRRYEGKSIRLVANDVNHGKGYAVRQGFLAATGVYVLFTDADLSAPIDELSKLLEVAKRDKAEVVIGSRGLDRTVIEKRQTGFREFGGIAFNYVVRLMTGLKIKDTQCGFKLFLRE